MNEENKHIEENPDFFGIQANEVRIDPYIYE